MNTEKRTRIRARIRTELMQFETSKDIFDAITEIEETKNSPYDKTLTLAENEEHDQLNTDKLIACKGLLGQIEAVVPLTHDVTLIPEGALKAHIKERTSESHGFDPGHFPYNHMDWDAVVEAIEPYYYLVSAYDINFYIEGV